MLTVCCTLAGLAILGCSTDPQAAIDNYPNKTITIVCPWSAGGGTDQCSRFWADQLHQRLETPVVVMNREGGSGAIGHSAVARARPDGYTLGAITVELSMMKQMGISDLTFRDYDPLLQYNADSAALVVRSDAPWKTAEEFLEEVRTGDTPLKMSGTASGGIWDLARVGMLHAAGIDPDRVTWVPSKGSAPARTQLLGGHIDAVVVSVPEAKPQIDAGELRLLAVMDDERHVDFPEVPTLKELGIDWSAVGWRGLALPKETPPEISAKLLAQAEEIAASEEFLEFMKLNGFAVKVRGPEEFKEFLTEQEALWTPVIEMAGYHK
ncbi:tripartite tricarboxylate transporter substrate binding protein [Thalassoglobus neptunius]|uniref:tripartite tricarboxylate transporter substrate binding protein n=1 Tax=Thalassoglobus neptunius TaxID=1938619 RepID=UPI001E5D3DB7|nr:tripartite tricarboxylate transporter substrate binding protein [Thalassoglobus neptunius]